MWATLGTVLLGGMFLGAGFWQLSRAEDKRLLLAGFDAGARAQAVAPPGPMESTETFRYRPIRAEGRFDPEHQILLDARTRDGKAGYEVLTPLVRSGQAILVNRGWVPANPDRRQLPEIAVGRQLRQVSGLLDQLPRAALAMEPGAATGWPRIMLFPAAADISAALNYPVADYQLLLDPAEPDGYRRDWRPALMSPAQHLGYAVQWFALAAALVVLYAVLNWQRTVPAPKGPGRNIHEQ